MGVNKTEFSQPKQFLRQDLGKVLYLVWEDSGLA